MRCHVDGPLQIAIVAARYFMDSQVTKYDTVLISSVRLCECEMMVVRKDQ